MTLEWDEKSNAYFRKKTPYTEDPESPDFMGYQDDPNSPNYNPTRNLPIYKNVFVHGSLVIVYQGYDKSKFPEMDEKLKQILDANPRAELKSLPLPCHIVSITGKKRRIGFIGTDD
jgi:hypothetical protein